MRNWSFHFKLIGSLYVLLCLLLCALVVMLSGCATQKKAEKYYKLHPEELAKKCAAEFPLKDTFITRTDSITRIDTVLQLEPVYIFDTLYVNGEPQVITRECPQSSIVTKYINTDRFLYVRDRAFEQTQSDSIQQLQKEKGKLQNDNSKLLGEKAQLQTQVKGEKKWMWWFIALCIVVLGGVGLKIYKALKPSINISK